MEGVTLDIQQAEAMADNAEKALYTGAGSTFFFGFTANEIGILIGAIVGVCGLLVTWYYKHKSYQLKKLLVEKQINELDDEDDE